MLFMGMGVASTVVGVIVGVSVIMPGPHGRAIGNSSQGLPMPD